MADVITILSSMSLLTSILLCMQYLLFACCSALSDRLLAMRPIFAAAGWFVLAIYLLMEIFHGQQHTSDGLEVLFLASSTLLALCALPSHRATAVTIVGIIIGFLFTFILHPVLPGPLLVALSFALMARNFHYVIPYNLPHRIYVVTKTSLLGYLLFSVAYTLSPLHAFGVDLAVVGSFVSLALMLVHLITMVWLFLSWMGVEIEKRAKLQNSGIRFAELLIHELGTPIALLRLGLSGLKAESPDAKIKFKCTKLLESVKQIDSILQGAWIFIDGHELNSKPSVREVEVENIHHIIEAAFLSFCATTADFNNLGINRSYCQKILTCGPSDQVIQIFLNLFLYLVHTFPPSDRLINITTSSFCNRNWEFVRVDIEKYFNKIYPTDAFQTFSNDVISETKSELNLAKSLTERNGGKFDIINDPKQHMIHIQIHLQTTNVKGF